MLFNARFSNFRSFSSETTLCMVSSSKIQKHPDHCREQNSKGKILKYAEIFGPNAAGKSNVIEFFSFFQYILRYQTRNNMKKLYCRMESSNQTKPSSFELQMSINNTVFSYGFSILFSELCITEEYLTIDENERSRIVLFHRINETISINEQYFAEDISRLNIYVDDFQANPNVLFLHFLNDSKQYEKNSTLKVFQQVYLYVINSITIIQPGSRISFPLQSFNIEGFADKISQYLHSFDTGITRMKNHPVSRQELLEEFPSGDLEEIEEALNQHKAQEEITIRSDKNFFSVRKNPNQNSMIYEEIQFCHGNTDCWMDFSEESDGTLRLFDLYGLYELKAENHIYIVDELDRSLHTKTVEKFLKHFMERNRNQNNQLIFTTHDTDLLDQNLFRRDEMWLIERSENGISHLYSLDRFKERSDIKLQKLYLEGRFGALPAFYQEDYE